MPREFTLPDLGEGITEAQIIRVMIKKGDTIAMDQSLMEVETDKAAVEIPSPYAGVAETVHVDEGQTVNVGEPIVTFDDGNGADTQTKAAPAKKTAPPAPEKPADKKPETSTPVAEPATSTKKTAVAAAPAIRKLARERGVDLDQIAGSGPGGRITREDVEGFSGSKGVSSGGATRRAPKPTGPLPGVAGADKWGPIRKEKFSQIRKTIAKQMSRSAFTAVHVTHGDEADVTELERTRHVLNEATNNDPKITLMAFVIKACCVALRKYPIFNSCYDEEGGQIIYKDYINIGIAVDTERGLIVPVLRNIDMLSLQEIAIELRSLADRIRNNKFEIEDLRGGTFSITNVGALGGSFGTPIINYPEVAILGLGRSKEVPVVRNNQVVPGLLLPVNVSFDHRATDGANAARFTREFIDHLENPALFLID